MEHGSYESELATRYASGEMCRLFSQAHRVRTWRALWIALAKAERELGLPITAEQIEELERQADSIDFAAAARREEVCRHEVMAHIYAYGLACPKARGILHLGATSCFVLDNGDLLTMREGLALLRRKLLNVLALLGDFADCHQSLPCLGYTHLQPAQLTTLGKRATLWLADFLADWRELDRQLTALPFRGAKGATGTQESFLALFDGDAAKVDALEEKLAAAFGFAEPLSVCGQTYSRKVDFQVAAVLAGLCQSAYKFAGDLRVLQSVHEVEEPFGQSQVGSSAMPYKRNPMKCERVCALARYGMAALQNPLFTAASQYFERTLDDSANKRLAMAGLFLTCDGILELLLDICAGLTVYPKVIARRVEEELPFLASEEILMRAVKAGGDRQALHERLRRHSMAAGRRVKEEGLPGNLLERVAADPAFGMDLAQLKALLDPAAFTGLAARQTRRFLQRELAPLLAQHADLLGMHAHLNV